MRSNPNPRLHLVYKLTKRHYGFNVPVEVAIAERHYGFEYGPLDAALGGDENKQTVYLDPSLKIMDGARRPNERADGWLEMELGNGGQARKKGILRGQRQGRIFQSQRQKSLVFLGSDLQSMSKL
ncbi:hypothetical protein ACLB2K_049334 [Fragaria x ananassa]